MILTIERRPPSNHFKENRPHTPQVCFGIVPVK
jgi:hypothetical protein